jgi:ABC-type cobalamin/Fe3+-siderophores transport system ATPase subunit
VGEPLVALDEVEVRRRGKAILGPVSLSVGAGGFVGVVGPNGAGKTTLLRVIAGLERPSSGKVATAGVAPWSWHGRKTARRKIGFLFQHHDYLPELPFTVEDVVLFGRTGLAGLCRRPGRSDREAVEAALDALGLMPLRHRLYRELSGGERQKAHLARIVAQGAELVLLDEPASGLDLVWQERMTALAEEVFDGGRRTVVMVTHEIDRLPACCTRAVLMKDGLVQQEGRPADVFGRERLSEIYGCEMEVVPRGGRWHAFSVGEGAAC